MKVYLDTSVYKRPFDQQEHPRIWLETLAFGVILQMVTEGEIDLVASEVVEYENSRNPVALRRAWMDRCLGLAKYRIAMSHDILNRAKALEAQGIGGLDSLHLACAETGGAIHFLTCDDRVVERYAGSLKVQNPVDYVVSGKGMGPWQ